MKMFVTHIKAICPITKELKTCEGPLIKALSFDDADYYCQNNGLGYCFVIGELIDEIGNLNFYPLN
jgi:hypothetical protein